MLVSEACMDVFLKLAVVPDEGKVGVYIAPAAAAVVDEATELLAKTGEGTAVDDVTPGVEKAMDGAAAEDVTAVVVVRRVDVVVTPPPPPPPPPTPPPLPHVVPLSQQSPGTQYVPAARKNHDH